MSNHGRTHTYKASRARHLVPGIARQASRAVAYLSNHEDGKFHEDWTISGSE